MIFIVYFLIYEIQSFLHLKRSYFHRFQSYVQLSIIIISWTCLAIYIWRYRESKRISALFRQTNGYVYINLQLVSYVNDLLTYMLSLCCFFGTIRFAYLCRFNQRSLLFSHTLRNAARELLSFAMMFSIMFFAFVCLFYFLFNAHLQSCSSLLQTARLLFEMTLMKFDAHELIHSKGFLGPFCFSLFTLIVVFVCMSMFVSIINGSFRRARDDVNRRNDEEILFFMIDKFLRWIGKEIFVDESNSDIILGWRKPTPAELYQQYDAQMRQEYFDPIERFPERIDQLLDVINRVCLDSFRIYLQSIIFSCT